MSVNHTKVNEKFVGYLDHRESAELIVKHGTINNVEVLDDGTRRMFVDGTIIDFKTINKEKGAGYGDICTICSMAVLVDSGGCATCPNCGAQLRCGL